MFKEKDLIRILNKVEPGVAAGAITRSEPGRNIEDDVRSVSGLIVDLNMEKYEESEDVQTFKNLYKTAFDRIYNVAMANISSFALVIELTPDEQNILDSFVAFYFDALKDVDLLEEDVEESEEEIEDLDKEVRDLIDDVKAKEKEIAELEEIISGLEFDLDKVETDLNVAEKKYVKMRSIVLTRFNNLQSFTAYDNFYLGGQSRDQVFEVWKDAIKKCSSLFTATYPRTL